MTGLKTMMAALTVGLLAGAALAGDGPADKVTGSLLNASFSNEPCPECPPGIQVNLENANGKEISAHEALGKRLQHGFVYILRVDGTWDLIDLGNGVDSCVYVYADGRARIGGLVVDGTGPGLGRYFGFEVEDKGEPGKWADLITTVRFPPLSVNPESRENFGAWCAVGNREGNTAVWPGLVVDGNLKVHNYPGDGD
jgi:hypothetical protein